MCGAPTTLPRPPNPRGGPGGLRGMCTRFVSRVSGMSMFPSEGLSRFASLPPADRTSTLLRALVDLFVSGTDHRRDDVFLFEELFLSVYGDAAEADRAAVARLLAARTDLPAGVAAAIGFDVEAVAAAFLPLSPAVTPLDLTRIACLKGLAHRKLIAGRPGLDRQVIAALIHDGEAPVLEVLLDNPGLDLTPEDLDRIRRGSREPTIVNRLARRGDWPPPVLVDDFFALDTDARWTALKTFAAETALKRPLRRGRQGGRAETGGQASGSVGAMLFEAAARRDNEAIAGHLARALDLDPALAARIAADPGGEPLAVALAALGIDETTATGVLLLSVGGGAGGYRRMQSLAILYPTIGWRTGEAMIERWRGSPAAGRAETLRQLDEAEGVRRAGTATARRDAGAVGTATTAARRA